MKHLPLILAALALSSPVLQAKVFDITLTNADTYTQCDIKYRGSRTKFIGTDKNGKVQTVEIASSRILNIREVEPEVKEEPKPAPAPAEEPRAEEKPAADTPAPAEAEAEKPADAAAPAETKPADEPKAEEKPAEEASPGSPTDGQAQNASLRLREKLAEIDREYAGLRAPSKSLSRRMSYTRDRIVSSLDKLDEQALKVAKLQDEFNKAGCGDFVFEYGSEEQRSQYVRDGEAAYKAMVIDMKEKPGARKVGGLDKFEIMRERYQGIPEYKEAYAWYIKTLKALDIKWNKMLDKEEKQRKRLQPAKKSAMNEADAEELEKLAAEFEKDGENISNVWFNPRKRNMQMLKLACNKVKDALRRNQNVQLDEAVGTVPSLLGELWAAMDESRRLLIEGQLDQAEDTLKKAQSYDKLRAMRVDIFPRDYREPVMAQYKKLEDEIRTRKRNVRNTMTKMEREASQLERSTGSAEAQINALMEEIMREKNLDAGTNTVDMEQSMNEPEEEAAEEPKAEAPAAPAAEEPKKD